MPTPYILKNLKKINRHSYGIKMDYLSFMALQDLKIYEENEVFSYECFNQV